MVKNDYVRLVRDNTGKVIDSFDANPEFEAMQMEINLQAQVIRDLRELLANTRHIALEVAQANVSITGNGTAGREADVRPTGFFFQMPKGGA